MPECPNEFPDGCNYKELTEELMLSHKRTNNVLSGYRPVGAIASSTLIEEVPDENDASFIAGAIMPSVVLGSGSETEEEVSAPLAHLHWPCLMIGPGTDKPITVNSVLNCEAHIGLINSKLADQLHLHCYHLHKPLSISVALNNSSSADSHLHKYVKLAPYTPDSS